MAKKIFNSIATLLAATALVTLGGTPAWAQVTGPDDAAPELQQRCTTVAVSSDTPLLPQPVVATYLQQRADFQASKLGLIADPKSADAIVTLTMSGARDTRIQVSNRNSGNYTSVNSPWTDFPGMIASSVMELLRSACPGSVVALAQPPRATPECSQPPAELRTLTKVAACSQTSWMDTRDISKALEKRPELKQWAVNVTPACDGGGAELDITHNLNLTVEWFWSLRVHGANAISSGRVIAFTKRDAASKIAAAVTRDIAFAHGAELRTVSVASSAPEGYGKSGHTVGVLLLPTDFSVPDTRTALFIDDERVIARDIHNRVIFEVTREQVRDVRLRADWRHDFQLSDPTPLAQRASGDLGDVFLNRGVDPAMDLTTKKRSSLCRLEGSAWALMVGYPPLPQPANVCPVLDTSKAALSSAGLMGYLGVGTVLAQIPTRAEILEIAWEQDGSVKTVSLQVPLLESKRLFRALQPSGSGEQEQVCSSPTVVATSQR